MFVNEIVYESTLMPRTFGLELTSLINSDPAWKVVKGSRSSSGCARKKVYKSLQDHTGLFCASSVGFNMPVSGTEKHGVSTSGYRFDNKAEHVPIKKRRFLLRSPSPPPVKMSPCTEETTDHTRSQDVSSKPVPFHSSSDFNLSQIVENNNCSDAKKSDKSKSLGEDEDFSGISILAAAACSSSLGRDCGYVEGGSGIEESSVPERVREVSANTEVRISYKELLKEDILNSSEIPSAATSSCIFTEPLGELASISTPENSSLNVAIVGEGRKDASLGSDSLTFSRDDLCSKDEDIVRNQRLSSRDDRLHWDLNVVMDAWEQPFDDPGVQSDVAHHISQDAGKVKPDDNMQLEGHDSRETLETVYAPQSSLLPGEPIALTNQSSGEIKVNHDNDAYLNLKQPLSSNSNLNMDVMKCMVEDTKKSHCEEAGNPTDEIVFAADDQTNQLSLSCTINEAENASVKSVNLNDKHISYQPVMDSLKSDVDVSYSQLQNLGNECASNAMFGAASADTDISLCVSSSSKVKEVVADPEDLETLKIFHHEEKALVENVDMKTVEPQEHAEFATSDNNGLPPPEASNSVSKRCELLVALDTKVHDVSNVLDGNIVSNNEAVKHLSVNCPVTIKDSCDFYYHETCKTNMDNCSNCSDNIDHEVYLKHSNDAGVQCYPVLVVETDAAGELQEDYDSQYEDGELRESSGRWEEYDAVDREAENVDCVSTRETYIANPSDYHVSDSGQVEDRKSGKLENAAAVSSRDCSNENEDSRKAAEVVGTGRGLDEGNQITSSHVGEKAELTQEKELLDSSRSYPDIATRDADDNVEKNKMPSHLDGLLDSQGTETRAEPKPFRRCLQSQIEGPVVRDDAYREEQLKRMENRFEPGMRAFERVRYSFHNQGRGHQGVRWDGSSDSRRGFRRHYSPIVHRYPKLDDDAVMERDDHTCVGIQDDVSSYSQQLPKSRADTDGEPCAGFHSRYKSDRKFSPGRAGGFGRGRSFRYGPFAESRGGRGGYNGPSPDESFQSSLTYRRPLSRRERSPSPFGGRGQSNVHHSRRKSPSRSRSRSPVIWNSARRRLGPGSGGNTFFNGRSRSPNFRPQVRVQRLRSPQQQPGFGIDHAGGFRSISRNHGSPPHNRWSSARKDELDQFRELGYKQRTSALDRSPGRIRLRDDRGTGIDSQRNLKPDGYYRISDRIPDDAARGVRYEETFEDRRKQYNVLRPMRRSFDDGMASRLHQDVNDSFSMANSFRDRDASNFQDRGLRGIDSRIGDISRRFRGENHSFVYERDGKFNPNIKQFGVDAVDSGHDLKSEEQYRPNCTGRFADTNGANRGCRYEN